MLSKKTKAARHTGSAVLRALIWGSAAVTAALLVTLVVYIAVRGVPQLRPSLFSLIYTSENLSMLPALLNTVTMTVLTLILAVPAGVFAAVYLTEFAPHGSRIVRVIRMAAETLSGIPSIVYGLFGFLAFVVAARWYFSLAAGVLTLAVMVLPTILRTAEEAILAVPDSLREGSLALGASRVRTIFKIVLPAASRGILSGVILSIGRIVGESAALIFTAGTSPEIALGPFDSARTLAVHMYCLFSEGLHTNEAYATGFVLLLLAAGINAASGALAKRLSDV
ncbi:MAG: phosphate ABC transporter permease PstA [Eubacteriales bacterium]